MNKYYELSELKVILDRERSAGKTIALANGGFDLVHVGHVHYLQGAKQEADILVAALNSDSSLKRLKGDHRAVLDEASRIRIISSFHSVDYVTVFGEQTVDRVLQTLKPDVHCKGSDYTPETVPERDTVRAYGGRTAIVGGPKIRNTSDIIKSVRRTGWA